MIPMLPITTVMVTLITGDVVDDRGESDGSTRETRIRTLLHTARIEGGLQLCSPFVSSPGNAAQKCTSKHSQGSGFL